MTPTNLPIPAPPAARPRPPIPPAAREAPPAAPPRSAGNRRLTGQRGEGIAADYLRDSGWRILDRNWRAPAGSGLRGELDIIAEDPAGALVIVEVKTRSSLRAGPPAAAVTPVKEARLRRLAIAWAGRRGAPPHRLRLDVVSVILREGAPALLRHHRAVCGS